MFSTLLLRILMSKLILWPVEGYQFRDSFIFHLKFILDLYYFVLFKPPTFVRRLSVNKFFIFFYSAEIYYQVPEYTIINVWFLPSKGLRPGREKDRYIDNYNPGCWCHSGAWVASWGDVYVGYSCGQRHTLHCHGALDFIGLKYNLPLLFLSIRI